MNAANDPAYREPADLDVPPDEEQPFTVHERKGDGSLWTVLEVDTEADPSAAEFVEYTTIPGEEPLPTDVAAPPPARPRRGKLHGADSPWGWYDNRGATLRTIARKP